MRVQENLGGARKSDFSFIMRSRKGPVLDVCRTGTKHFVMIQILSLISLLLIMLLLYEN